MSFTLLDGFNLVKPGQYLRRRSDLNERFDGSAGEPRCFTQIGRGVLPCEYRVDRSNRLLVVVTGTRGYFLDDTAEDRIVDHEENQKIYEGHGAFVPVAERGDA